MRTIALLLALIPTSAALAQEAMYTEAATMPSKGVFVLRQQAHYMQHGDDPDSSVDKFSEIESMTTLQYGLGKGWSVRLDVPVVFRWDDLAGGGEDSSQGFDDLNVMVKHRFYKNDTGGVDTVRAAFMLGAEFASGDSFSSQAFNPYAGAVLTIVRGRHGLNAEATFKYTTAGDDDHNTGGEAAPEALFANFSYLYRLAPARYTAETTGAWYATAELLNTYETNGDFETRGSLGIMYEGREFAFEAMVILPVYNDVQHRSELDLAIGAGLRFTF